MSTVVRRRQTSTTGQPATNSSASAQPSRRRGRSLALAGALLLLLVWAAPLIVANTPLRHWLISAAGLPINGSLQIGSASLGWFSPIVIDNVELHSAPTATSATATGGSTIGTSTIGKPLLHATRIRSEKSLLSLLLAPNDLGKLHVEQPQLELQLRDDGSNLEDLLAPLLVSKETSTGTPTLAVELVDGEAVVRDTTTGFEWRIENLSALVSLEPLHQNRLEARLGGSIAQPGGAAPFQAQLVSTTGRGELKATAENFPLTVLQAPLRRLIEGCQLAGVAQTKLTCQWGQNEQGSPHLTLKGQLSGAHLMLSAAALGRDRLQLEQTTLNVEASRSGDELRAAITGNCDVGQFTCQSILPGAARLLEHFELPLLLEAAVRGTTDLEGRLVLAPLARLLPGTLRIRPGTQITEGVVNLLATSRPQEGRSVFQARAETSQLKALHEGRELVWQRPIQFTLAGHSDARDYFFQQIRCESDFLQIEGSGTPADFLADASCNLDRLTSELGQFVDLSDIRLRGQGQAQLRCQSTTDHQLSAAASLQFQNLDATFGDLSLRESDLKVEASLAGLAAEDYLPQRIDSARLTATAAGDKLQVELLQPVVSPLASSSSWPLRATASGQLATWLQRLATPLPQLAACRGEGALELVADLVATPEQLDVQSSRLLCKPLRFAGYGLSIDEPTARVELAALWQFLAAKAEVRQCVVDTPALSLQSKDVVIDYAGARGTQLRGSLAFAGEVERLARWISSSLSPDWHLRGQLKGQTLLEQVGNQGNWQLEATINNLVATPRHGRQWHEPQVRLATAATLDHQADKLSFKNCTLSSEMLSVQLEGDINQLSTARQAQLQGRINYDLDRIGRVLEPYVGRGIQLAGRQSHGFVLQGPLAPEGSSTVNWVQQLQGRTELGWQWANLFGFQLGRATTHANLQNGIVRVEPLEVAVNRGLLRLAPQLRLVPDPMQLAMPAGRVIERVDVTPEMCQQLIRYALPAVGNSVQAQVQGNFSLALDSMLLNLGDINRSDAAGQMTIHQMDITGGPFVQELAMLTGRPGTARLKQESVVRFRVAEGRVHHQGMELIFPDLTIRTQGSVGFDQSLSLMAEMPIPPKWVGNNPLGDALKNRTVQLPIGGTLDRPQLDRRALDQVAAQVMREAGAGVIQQQLNRQIDKLFGPLP